MFAKYPGSDLDQLARYVETAYAIIRFAARGDADMLRRALNQLTNIVTGWSLSIEISEGELIRQDELEKDRTAEEE